MLISLVKLFSRVVLSIVCHPKSSSQRLQEENMNNIISGGVEGCPRGQRLILCKHCLGDKMAKYWIHPTS